MARQERDALNQQLLNTIKHKVALSQEVESWQVGNMQLISNSVLIGLLDFVSKELLPRNHPEHLENVYLLCTAQRAVLDIFSRMQKHSSVFTAFVWSTSGVSIRTLLVPEIPNSKGHSNTVLL